LGKLRRLFRQRQSEDVTSNNDRILVGTKLDAPPEEGLERLAVLRRRPVETRLLH
jgi:hypothetical protein